MSFDSLQERLTALQETTTQVQELIDRLANLKFQPGSAPLPPHGDGNGNGEDEDDENVAAELSAEINQTLRDEEEDLELLAEEITDLRGGKEGSEAARRKERLREGLARMEGEVKSTRASFHKAQLASRRSLESARRLERELLLQSYTRATSTPSRSGANSPAPSSLAPAHPRRRGTQRQQQQGASAGYDDPVVAASSDLTLSLRRAHQAVTAELGRSMAVRGALAESTDKVRRLGSGYARVDDMLRSSRDLVGVLLRSTKTDTWYLQTTFSLLVATLAWLVFRRFLYGPLWWLVWFPARLAFRTGSSAVGMVGGAGAGAGGRPAGASMGVVDGSGAAKVVGVGEEGAVPTLEVGRAGAKMVGGEAREGDPGSMVEEVGRIVDRIEEQVGGGDGEGEGEPEPELEAEVFVPASDEPNVAQAEAGRVRDEL